MFQIIVCLRIYFCLTVQRVLAKYATWSRPSKPKPFKAKLLVKGQGRAEGLFMGGLLHLSLAAQALHILLPWALAFLARKTHANFLSTPVKIRK